METNKVISNNAVKQPTVQPTVDLKEKAQAHVVKLREHLQTFAGKAGYNPFMWDHQHIKPLLEKQDWAGLLAINIVDIEPKAVSDFKR